MRRFDPDPRLQSFQRKPIGFRGLNRSAHFAFNARDSTSGSLTDATTMEVVVR
jgi:hypothetical protein